MRLIHVFYDNVFGIPMECGIRIEELTNTLDIILLVKTWEHDAQRVEGLGNYSVHSLIWVKKVKTMKKGAMSYLIKREIEKYELIIKDDEHKFNWLKVETPKDLPTFVVR